MSKIVIAIPMDESLQEVFHDYLKENPFAPEDEIHFVHIFREEHLNYIMPPVSYPIPGDKPIIEKEILGIMKSLVERAELNNVKTLEYRCLFNESPKDMMISYLKNLNADLVISTTRGKKGFTSLFASSFSEHLLKWAPCRLLVLRGTSDEK